MQTNTTMFSMFSVGHMTLAIIRGLRFLSYTRSTVILSGWITMAYAYLVIPDTRRVKGYTRFVGKYVTGRRKRFRPHKVYIFLIRIISRVDLAMSVCPSVRMNAEISESMRVTKLGLGTQIPEIPAQRKFVSVECHAHSNAHKPPKTVAPTVLMLDR